MKKNIKRFISVLVSISALISCAAFNSYAVDSESMYAQNVLNNVAEAWEENKTYPVVPGDGTWEKLSYLQQLEATNMPQNMLTNLTTDELANLVLDYPFLIDVVTFETSEMAIEHLKNTSNICNEFFSRSNSVNIMLNKYNELQVNYNMLINKSSENSNDVVKESGYTKELFLQTYFAEKGDLLDKSQKEVLQTIVQDKHSQKSDMCESYSGVFTNELLSIFSPYEMSNVLETNNTASSTYVSSGFTSDGNVSTRNGVTYYVGTYALYGQEEICYKYKSGDAYPTTLQQLDNSFEIAHSSWTKIHPASYKYNCHSYAWINASSYNIYWLDSVNAFANSSYFNYINRNGSANSGDRIILRGSYANALHSVIVNSYGSNINTINTTSKFGSYGVYDAPLVDVMTYYSQNGGASYYETYRQA